MNPDTGTGLKPDTIQHIKDRKIEHQEKVSKQISEYGIVSRFAKIPGIHNALNRLARHDVAKDVRIENLREKAKNAFIDPLTGLPNRRGFFTAYRLEIERAKRERHPLTLVAMDIDGFKEINDTKGHAEGDKMLRAIAKILRGNIREIDSPARLEDKEENEHNNGDELLGVPARMGGDEFVLLLPGTTPEEAQKLWERIRPKLAEQGIKVSAGAAKVDLKNGTQSLVDADLAMYASKSIGNGSMQISGSST